MTMPTLEDVKAFLRIDGNHLDTVVSMAYAAAQAEAANFVGGELAERWPSHLPSDVAMALVLLVQVHVDAGTPQEHQYRRCAAQNLLRSYRLDSGIGGAA
jgi:hypothetical protein